jgi:autotransporter translocation and assembly factor TamB
MVDSSSADVGEGGSPRATDPPPSPPPQETPPPDDDPVEIIEEVLDAVEMITPKQLQKLHIVLKETGWWNQESREKGLQFYCDVTGRDDITSSKDLTKHEASQVIDLLQQGLEIEDQE